MKLLVVEDDKTVGQYVKRGLEEQQYIADWVTDGVEALRVASSVPYDLIILDLRLPGNDRHRGAAHAARSRAHLPVLVLTAQDSVEFKVDALRAGADDYVTKPFSFEELLARVEALSRRPKLLTARALQVADLELDLESREVQRDGKPIELTPKEYAVLEYLMRHTGRVMSRTLITEYAWDYHFDPGHQHRRRRDQSPAQEGRRRLSRRSWCTRCAAWDTWSRGRCSRSASGWRSTTRSP